MRRWIGQPHNSPQARARKSNDSAVSVEPSGDGCSSDSSDSMADDTDCQTAIRIFLEAEQDEEVCGVSVGIKPWRRLAKFVNELLTG